MNKNSLRQRFRYWLDRRMSKGTSGMVKLLVITVLGSVLGSVDGSVLGSVVGSVDGVDGSVLGKLPPAASILMCFSVTVAFPLSA